MKNKRFTAVFLISIFILTSVIAVLWIKNNELKKELDEYSPYKRIFVSFNGIVFSVAPVKAEDKNKPLYFEHSIDGIVSTFPVAKNSTGLKDGGKLFLVEKYLLLQGNSGQILYSAMNNIYKDIHKYPKVLNYGRSVSPGEYFIKFGNYGLTTDFKQLSPKENGIRLTFTDSEKPQMSETLQNFLIAVQLPDYSKQAQAELNDLERQAELLKMAMREFNSGTKGIDSVLKEELRLLDILMSGKSLTGQMKELLKKEYGKRLNQLYTLKKAEFNAGILSAEDFKSYPKAVSDFKNSNKNDMK